MAEGINKVILIGNLGKDPETGFTANNTPRCRLTVATTESYMSNNNERQERTEWHNVIVWGKQAETVGRYLTKGRQVYIEGRLQTRSWDDEKTGQKRYMTEVVAQRVLFLGGGRSEGGRGGDGGGGGGGYGGGGGGGYGGGGGGGYGGGGGGGGYGGGDFNPPDNASNPPDDDMPF